MNVYFSYWWDPPGKKEFSALKYTPKQSGKWENLTVVDDLQSADVVVVFDVCCASEREYLLSGKTNKKILWFTREPPDIHPGNLTREKEFRNELESRGIEFYDYLSDEIPLLSTWHVHGDYDYYSALDYQNKSKLLSTIISHKSTNDPDIIKAVSQGVSQEEFNSGLEHFLHKLVQSFSQENSQGRGYSARKLIMTKAIIESAGLDVFGRINDTALAKSLASYSDEIKTCFLGSVNPSEKYTAYRDYHYSLVFENSSHLNYFSEKINDSFLEWTMPVYWGCKNIEDYFPKEALIKIEKDDILDPDGFISKLNALKNPSKINIEAIKESRDLILNKYNLMAQIKDLV